MGKWKYIRNDTYRRGITIFIGSRDEFLDFLEKSSYRKDEELLREAKNGNALATCFNDKEDGQSLIYFPEQPNTPTLIAALAHEILHATFFILNFCGVYHTVESEEAFTYLHEYLLSNALTEKGYKNVG